MFQRFPSLTLLAVLLGAGAARADVPNVAQVACQGLTPGNCCNVNLALGAGYQDGGNGMCGDGQCCDNHPFPDGGRTCSTCLLCDPNAEVAHCQPVGSSGSTGSGSTTGSAHAGTTGSSSGTLGTSGGSGGCHASASAVGPWLLAMLAPLVIRRRKV